MVNESIFMNILITIISAVTLYIGNLIAPNTYIMETSNPTIVSNQSNNKANIENIYVDECQTIYLQDTTNKTELQENRLSTENYGVSIQFDTSGFLLDKNLDIVVCLNKESGRLINFFYI